MIQVRPSQRVPFAVLSVALLNACGASPAADRELDGGDATVWDGSNHEEAGLDASQTGEDSRVQPQRDLYCEEAMAKGTLQDRALDEVSGLARSYRTPGEYWVVNDSGAPTVHRISSDGKTTASWPIPGVSLKDWEDIASYQVDGTPWMVVGDIGDNSARTGSGATREALALYRFEEAEQAPTAGQVETLTFTYPNGPRDAEALFVDPANQDIWIVTKDDDSHNTEVYVWRYPQVSGAQPELAGTLALGASPSLINSATSADLSDDRRRLWLRTYSAVLVWQMKPSELIEDVLKREPVNMRAPFEIQGEAIVDNGMGFVTIAEGNGATVYQALCI